MERPKQEIITEEITVENKQTLSELLHHDRIHLSKEALSAITAEALEIESKEITTHKHTVLTELEDGVFIETTGNTPYSMQEFTTTLSGLVGEQYGAGITLNTNGTRDNPPRNVFFVDTAGSVQKFTLRQDKNSDGTTFLHWFLTIAEAGATPLTAGTVVFSK